MLSILLLFNCKTSTLKCNKCTLLNYCKLLFNEKKILKLKAFNFYVYNLDRLLLYCEFLYNLYTAIKLNLKTV